MARNGVAAIPAAAGTTTDRAPPPRRRPRHTCLLAFYDHHRRYPWQHPDPTHALRWCCQKLRALACDAHRYAERHPCLALETLPESVACVDIAAQVQGDIDGERFVASLPPRLRTAVSRHRYYWLSVIVLGIGLAVSTYVFYFTDSPTPQKDKTHIQVPVKKIPAEQVLFLHPGQQVVFRLTRPAPPKIEIQKGVVVYVWRTDTGKITFADDREIHYIAPKQSGVADLIEYRLPQEQPIFSLMVMTRGNRQVQKMEEEARRASSRSSKEYGVGTAQFRLRVVLDSAAN